MAISVNPDRRDPGSLRKKADVGLPSVDNISAHDYIDMISDDVKELENIKKTDEANTINGTGYYGILKQTGLPSHAIFVVGFFNKNEKTTDIYRTELAQLRVELSCEDSKVTYSTFFPEGDKILENLEIVVTYKEEGKTDNIYVTLHPKSTSLGFDLLGTNILEWTPTTSYITCEDYTEVLKNGKELARIPLDHSRSNTIGKIAYTETDTKIIYKETENISNDDQNYGLCRPTNCTFFDGSLDYWDSTKTKSQEELWLSNLSTDKTDVVTVGVIKDLSGYLFNQVLPKFIKFQGGTNSFTVTTNHGYSETVNVTPEIDNNVVSDGKALTQDTIILGDGLTVVKSSGKKIESTLSGSDSMVPTSKAIADYVGQFTANATHFKGSFDASNGNIKDTSDTLTSVVNQTGDVYTVSSEGTYAGTFLEVGDSIIFKKNVAAGTAPKADDIVFIEATVSVSSDNPTLAWGTEKKIGTVEGVDLKVTLPANPNTDTKVTSADNHYTPSSDSSSELTNTVSSTGNYAKDTEYSMVTGVKLQRDTKGHVVGITTTNQKIKDTNSDTELQAANLYAGTGSSSNATVTNGEVKIAANVGGGVGSTITLKGSGSTQVSSNDGVVTINSTGTEYTGGTGIEIDSRNNSINHTNSVTPPESSLGNNSITQINSGSTIKIPTLKYDAQGHITEAEEKSLKVNHISAGSVNPNSIGFGIGSPDIALTGQNGLEVSCDETGYEIFLKQRQVNIHAGDNINVSTTGCDEYKNIVDYVISVPPLSDHKANFHLPIGTKFKESLVSGYLENNLLSGSKEMNLWSEELSTSSSISNSNYDDQLILFSSKDAYNSFPTGLDYSNTKQPGDFTSYSANVHTIIKRANDENHNNGLFISKQIGTQLKTGNRYTLSFNVKFSSLNDIFPSLQVGFLNDTNELRSYNGEDLVQTRLHIIGSNVTYNLDDPRIMRVFEFSDGVNSGSTDWFRVYYIFEVDNNISSGSYLVFKSCYTGSDISEFGNSVEEVFLSVCGIKLEEGENYNPIWSPSQEDLQELYGSSGSGTGDYKLPTASSSTLGGIKVGDGLTISSTSKLSISPATETTIGGIIVGEEFSISSAGKLSLNLGGGESLQSLTESIMNSCKKNLLKDSLTMPSTTWETSWDDGLDRIVELYKSPIGLDESMYYVNAFSEYKNQPESFHYVTIPIITYRSINLEAESYYTLSFFAMGLYSINVTIDNMSIISANGDISAQKKNVSFYPDRSFSEEYNDNKEVPLWVRCYMIFKTDSSTAVRTLEITCGVHEGQTNPTDAQRKGTSICGVMLERGINYSPRYELESGGGDIDEDAVAKIVDQKIAAIPDASTSARGMMTTTDKSRLNNLYSNLGSVPKIEMMSYSDYANKSGTLSNGVYLIYQ